MLSTVKPPAESPKTPPVFAKRRATLGFSRKFNQLFHEDSLIASTPLPKAQRRFSLSIFSKDRKDQKSVVSRPLSVATFSEPIHTDPDHDKTSLFTIDGSVLTGSFDNLNFDSNSFMADLSTEDPSVPALNSKLEELSKNSKISTDDSHVKNAGQDITNNLGNQPIADPNHYLQPTSGIESHSRRSSRRHSFSSSFVLSRRPSIKRLRSTSTSLSRKGLDHKSDDVKTLETEFHRFTSKTGVKKANVLRLALLPFLRQHRGKFFQGDDIMRRVQIFQKWWGGILSALRDREKPVSGSDRAAFLEGIAGLVCRTEWFVNDLPPQATCIFESMLFDTLRFVVAKLSLKTVPISFSAFSGKIIAYAFFYAPGVASVLLYLLRVSTTDVRRIVKVSFTNSRPGPRHAAFTDAVSLVKDSFPHHLHDLIGSKRASKMTHKPPPCPSEVPDLLGPWVCRWTNFNSDVFCSFLKHYYTILSQLLPAELPWNAHIASPGLLIIHAFLLGILDSVVHPRTSAQNTENDFLPNSHAVNLAPVMYGRRRVDQLKMLAAIREILHNEPSCAPMFEAFSTEFEKILHAVALKTSLYKVGSCVILCDLVEEFLSSIILVNPYNKNRPLTQMQSFVDWEFWIRVIKMLLSGENSNTQLRALAFLFNVWEHIPIGLSYGMTEEQREERPEEYDIFDLYIDEQEGLRWNFSVWLLSPELWQRYFCHWHTLVRAYYLRLLCWRIASIGTGSGLSSSVIFSNYNSDIRFLLEKRLEYTFMRYQGVKNVNTHAGKVSSFACDPVLNKRLAIVYNPACNHDIFRMGEAHDVTKQRRIDPYDVFDDIVYSLPTNNTKGNLDFPLAKHEDEKFNQTKIFGSSLKKRWSDIKGHSRDNLKKYFSMSSDDVYNKSEEYPPSLAFSSSTMSTESYGESISSVHSTDDSDEEQHTSLTLSLIPPPPQFLRKRPEIIRTRFKFSLQQNEKSIQHHNDKIHHRRQHDFTTHVRSPRLPFDSNQTFVVSAAETPNREEIVEIVNSEFEEAGRVQNDEEYFKYGGRALNEWTRVVNEFEGYIFDRRIKEGITKLEDIEMPFMVAEIKVLQ